MAIWRLVAYMSTQPSPDAPEGGMRELCSVLDTELEVMTNLIYLASQRHLQHDECERYLRIAEMAVHRMRKVVMEHC